VDWLSSLAGLSRRRARPGERRGRPVGPAERARLPQKLARLVDEWRCSHLPRRVSMATAAAAVAASADSDADNEHRGVDE